MKYRTLLVDIQDKVFTITLNCPQKLNALSKELIGEFKTALALFSDDEHTRVVIVNGNKKAFCCGADLEEIKRIKTIKEFQDYIREVQSLFQLIEGLNKPVIAAIAGMAFGGGLELALACDIRLCSQEAIFAVPEINIGFLPSAGGMSRLPWLIGKGRAAEMIYTGRRVNATEAHSWGLANILTESDSLEKEASELAKGISEKSPVAIHMAKKLLTLTNSGNIQVAKELEVYSAGTLFSLPETQEILNRFDKRKH
jgi:enoyl-CoA hydratase/carnithine racemase